MAVFVAYFFNGGGNRATDFNPADALLFFQMAQPMLGIEGYLVLILASEAMVDEVAVGRVVEGAAVVHLFFDKPIEVLPSCVLDGRAVREETLNDYFARAVATACATSDLDEQLETALGGPKIRHVQRDIGIKQADQGDIWEIQPFGYHLSAHQDINFASTEIGENLAEEVFALHGIGVDSNDFCCREEFLSNSFDTLGASALPLNGLRVAFGAVLWGGLLETTEMTTNNIIRAVVGEGDAAMIASWHVAAIGAEARGVKTAPIDEEDGLFLTVETLLEFINEESGKKRRAHIAPLFAAHIGYEKDRKFSVINSGRKFV